MVNVKPVTLYDVAEYAGVSYQTVSRVVNQASHVSAKTREKVEAAMAELNYIPNRVAQQLAGKQSLLIGVATSSLALHAPSQIVAAIKSRSDQLGASVVVSMVERSGVEACKAAVHNLLAQRVSGLIINYPLDDQDAIAVEAACTNVPALFLDVSDQTPINSIIFSHEDGTRLGVEHLIVGNQHRSGNDALIQHLHGLLKTGHGTPVAFPFRYRLNLIASEIFMPASQTQTRRDRT